MRIRQWFGSPKPRTYRTRPYKPRNPQEAGFSDRQDRIQGFDPAALSEAAVIGVGGLGTWPALGLTQAGIKKVLLCDRDRRVEASNLNRQLYAPTQVGMPKVFALGATLARFGAGSTMIEAYPYHFEDMVALYGQDVFSTSKVAVIGVDSEKSRVAASRHFRRLRIPAIFSGVSREGKTGFVLIQSPDGPCYGCIFPQVITELAEKLQPVPCTPTPAMSPILHALSGLILEAIFSVLMPSLYHEWNYFYLCMDGSLPSGGSLLPTRTDCPLCGEGAGEESPGHTA